MCDVISPTLSSRTTLWMSGASLDSNHCMSNGSPSCAKFMLSNSSPKNSERASDVLYGPGFVQKLREHFVRLAVGDGSISKPSHNSRFKKRTTYKRRTASCDELSSSSDDRNFPFYGDSPTSCRRLGIVEHRVLTVAHDSLPLSDSKSSQDPLSRPSNTLHIKPTTSIAVLRQLFESKAKLSPNFNSDVATGRNCGQNSTKKLIRIDKVERLLDGETNNSTKTDELEFVQIAKRLKNLRSECIIAKEIRDSSVVKVHEEIERRSSPPPLIPPTDFSVPKQGPVESEGIGNGRGQTSPAAPPISLDQIKKTDAFFTVASYGAEKVSVDSSDGFVENIANGYASSDAARDGDALSPLSDDGEDGSDASTTLLRFEFEGSHVVLSKSNLADGDRKNSTNLAFDSDYPVVYAYVDEEEADDWGPGVKLHYVDYKALCLRLKHEKINRFRLAQASPQVDSVPKDERFLKD